LGFGFASVFAVFFGAQAMLFLLSVVAVARRRIAARQTQNPSTTFRPGRSSYCS
jgi:hypothetical protein